MRKIINTFKYGDKKVKASLAFAILAGVGTVVFIALALIFSTMLPFFLAIVCGFVTVSLVQTFMIEEEAHPTVIGNELQPPNRAIKSDIHIYETTVQLDEEKDITPKDKVRNGDLLDKTDAKNKKAKKDKSKKKNKKRNKEKTDTIEEKKQQKESETPNKKLVIIEPINEESVTKYTKKRVKKVKHKYRVKKDHRMAIIDRCDKLHISQTPAYIWVENNDFHMLLIENEPRHIVMSLFRLTEITYMKKVLADDKEDYKVFENSTLITDTFRPYLPDYLHNSNTTDLNAYKNLYGIGQGVYFTNKSAKNLFDLLGVEFLVEDKVTTSNKVNIFFKNCYKANIMLRDNVIDANGYADRISRILDDMAHSTISYAEFKDTLNLMIKNKLITQEFAAYYMEVRDKNSR